MTLTPNVKLWVAALKSGEFKQAYDKLKGYDPRTGEVGYCCLGVACVVYERETGNAVDELNSDNYLPARVQKWLGLRKHSGSYADGSLANLNDSHQKTFAQIAEVIESEPEGLFSTLVD